MIRLALIARCDGGGLAAVTQELWRHLRPVKTLVLDVESSRGVGDPSKYAGGPGEIRVITRFPQADDIQWLLTDVDVAWTVETPYTAAMCSQAKRMRVPVVLQAMPELYDKRECPNATVVVPTSWEQSTIPRSQLLPVPVARDRLPGRERSGVRTFVHVWSNAFEDRNGTEILLRALSSVTVPCNLLVRSPAKLRLPARVGHVEVVHDRAWYPNYWDGWQQDGDALIMVRRFGGLSLPMLEAASMGMPVISTDLAPQNEWIPSTTLLPVSDPRRVRMKGGTYPVWSADPLRLALIMDRLVRDNNLARWCSQQSIEYARTMSWETQLPVYEAFLDRVAAR